MFSFVEEAAENVVKGNVDSMSWMAVAVLGVAVVVALVANLYLDSQPIQIFPPVYTEGLPVIGTPLSFAKGPIEFVKRGYAAVGDCFTIKIAHKRITFMLSPAAHEVALMGNDTEVDMAEAYKFSVPIFGKGVVYDAPLEERYFHYKMLATGLKVQKLREYVPLMVKESKDFFDQWPDEGEVDLMEAMASLICLTASRCLLGKEVRESMQDEIAELIHVLDDGMQLISVFAPHAPIEAHRKRDRAREQIQHMFNGILRNRRETGFRGDDLLQVFMDTTRKDGSHCSDYIIVGLLVAAIFGGQHTSSITASWIGLHLSRAPAQLERVNEERKKLLEEHGNELNYDVLSKMNELHWTMKEVLRLYPTFILLMRTAVEERYYNGYNIPKGDIMMLSPTVTGRMETFWTNPNSFDPQRFNEKRAEDKQTKLKFLGFGGGRHSCMGEQFAFLQVKTIWSVLLSDFTIESVGKLNPPNYDAMVVCPKGKAMIRFKRKKPLVA